MDKKFIVVFILSILAIPSFSNNLETLSAAPTPGGPTSTTAVATADQAVMIGLSMEIQRPNNGTFFTVNNTLDAKVNDVVNNTLAIFISTIVNKQSEPIILSSFLISLYNSSVQTVAAHSIIETFDTSTPAKVQIPSNGSYTDVYSTNIPFGKIDEIYQLQYQYIFSPLSNATNTYLLNAPLNFTLHSANPPYSPPEFIIWAWWTITGVIAIQLIIGYYGNRKLKNKSGTK